MHQCKICNQGQLQRINGNFYDYLSRNSFEVWECDHCNSKQTIGQLSGNYYGQAYYGSEKGKFSFLMEKVFLFNHRRNANNFFNQFQPSSVLEVGCGRGYILSELKKLGCHVQGIESATAEKWILNNNDFPVHGVSDDSQWPIPDNSIDLVIIWHVLEHVTEPTDVLAEIYRVLSPGGTLCVSVPNVDSLQSNMGLPQWFHLDLPRHLFHFSQQGLQQLIETHHLHITEQRNGDILQNIFGWWQSLLNLVTPNNNNLLYRFIQGGKPWSTTPNKHQLIIQLVLLPIAIPIGIIGMLYENATNRSGTMTFFAKKPDTHSNTI